MGKQRSRAEQRRAGDHGGGQPAAQPLPGHFLRGELDGFGGRVLVQPSPDRLELRLRVRCRLVRGMLVFGWLAALFLATAAYIASPLSPLERCWPCWLLVLAVGGLGAVLALGGLWVLLDLGRVRFDRLTGRMTVGRLPGLREALPLGSIQSVLLVPGGVHHDRDEPYETFQVNLALRGDRPACLNLIEYIDRDRARRLAEGLAEFLGASLLDNLPPALQEQPMRPRRGGRQGWWRRKP